MLTNLGMLDRMHEGVIVLQGEDKSLEFANQTAVNMINQDEVSASSILEERDLLTKPIFKPTTLSLVEATSGGVIQAESRRSRSKPTPQVSLAQIIEEWNKDD